MDFDVDVSVNYTSASLKRISPAMLRLRLSPFPEIDGKTDTAMGLSPLRPIAPLLSGRLLLRADASGSFRSEGLQALYHFWTYIRRPGGFVSRDAFSTVTLRAHLGHVLIAERLRRTQPSDYRFRLVGTAICDRIGRDVTGHLASQVYDEPLFRQMQALADRTLHDNQPTRISGVLMPVRVKEKTATYLGNGFEALAVPVAANGTLPNQIVAVVAMD